MNLTSASEIKMLLERHGFRFSKAMGQNFLVAQWVPDQIAEESGVAEDCGVLEVGPGIGCLTEQLSKRAGKVLAVELDQRLKPVLKETLADCNNVEIIFDDVLKQNLCKLVEERFEGLRPMVCANLPYNVTSPLISAFIEAQCFERITVMIQREVARRIVAAPGTSEYGAFSIYVNWFCETEILFDVSPGCFMPQPKVTSSVIALTPRKAPAAETRDERFMLKVVHAAFNQRRKTMQNALSNGMGIPRETVVAALEQLGLDPMIRGERLSLEEYAKLSDILLDRD